MDEIIEADYCATIMVRTPAYIEAGPTLDPRVVEIVGYRRIGFAIAVQIAACAAKAKGNDIMTEKPVSTLQDAGLELGEGPTYDPATDTGWWFDIVGCALYEHSFSTERTVQHSLPRMGSVLAQIDDARQLLAMEDGLYVRDRNSGGLSLHLPLEADNPKTRSNDGRTHPSGALWIGTMGKNAEPGAGAIYWSRGKEIRTLYESISVPNAICFSRDGATGYFADSAKGQIMRVALDPATGLPIGKPVVFHDKGLDKGAPDGAVVDRNGILWNARWGAACVNAYAPDGRKLETISIPARQASCPAFCGREGGNLIVTSAWQGLSDERRSADPEAGNTFIVKGGFAGLFDPPYRLMD